MERVDPTGFTRKWEWYLKKSGRVLCEGVASRYAVIKELRLGYSL